MKWTPLKIKIIEIILLFYFIIRNDVVYSSLRVTKRVEFHFAIAEFIDLYLCIYLLLSSAKRNGFIIGGSSDSKPSSTLSF